MANAEPNPVPRVQERVRRLRICHLVVAKACGAASYSAVMPAAVAVSKKLQTKYPMIARKSSMMAVIAAAMLVPTLSMADTGWHQENTDRGYGYHPEHAKSTLSRAQVQSDARSAGPSQLIREGAPLDTFPTAAGKTREQVRHEWLSITAAEKQRLQQVLQGS